MIDSALCLKRDGPVFFYVKDTVRFPAKSATFVPVNKCTTYETMAKNLVIVESPAKAKTIEKFLGKDYKVESSFGHIADLPGKKLGIDTENGFTPQYEIDPSKKELVKKLKSLARDAQMVWLASDEDREGEAIAWHLYENLGLDPSRSRRIVFHEITKNAILRAIENPRTIDMNLVNAQQARRVLDRLVGYEISPLLWRKIKSGLSAGRVQSVAVRLIVEREREIQAFAAQSYYKVSAVFTTPQGAEVKAEMSARLAGEEQAAEFLQACLGSEFTVSDIETRPAKRTPAPPFTTSTLQQEAARKLGFSVSQTMTLAQRLYEEGLITYMRTDSVNLSQEAIANIQGEIVRRYGENYSCPRHYHTTSQGAQEAHEAIRPTYMDRDDAGADDRQRRLYNLIWRRAIACQMADAALERTTAQIAVSRSPHTLTAVGQVLLFDGFLKVYGYDSQNEEEGAPREGILPRMAVGDRLEYREIAATQRFTKAPARYGEAALVKKLEELGIGRPSTYAPTISTIQRREYVEKGDREGQQRSYVQFVLEGGEIKRQTLSETYGSERGKLLPTDIGAVVNDFLVSYFPNIVDYRFTAQAEEELDSIAEGKADWVASTDRFYATFHPHVEQVARTAERSTGQRVLGEDPKSGRPVSVRIGRYGPMVQIGRAEDEEKPLFASLPKGVSMGDVTLEQALELFRLPRKLGQREGKDVSASVGRFGPYVKWGTLFVSLRGTDQDPLSISLETANELIDKKISDDASKIIREFPGSDPAVSILNGRFGPYVKVGRENVKIPKDTDPASLSLEDCLALQKKQAEAPRKTSARRFARKKS